MHVTLVYVHVKEEHIDDFIAATRTNHEHSTEELGNQRFDVLQQDMDPTRFVLYEAYESTEDAAAHKITPHYMNWRKAVKNWMASPREGVVYNALLPKIGEQW